MYLENQEGDHFLRPLLSACFGVDMKRWLCRMLAGSASVWVLCVLSGHSDVGFHCVSNSTPVHFSKGKAWTSASYRTFHLWNFTLFNHNWFLIYFHAVHAVTILPSPTLGFPQEKTLSKGLVCTLPLWKIASGNRSEGLWAYEGIRKS